MDVREGGRRTAYIYRHAHTGVCVQREKINTHTHTHIHTHTHVLEPLGLGLDGHEVVVGVHDGVDGVVHGNEVHARVRGLVGGPGEVEDAHVVVPVEWSVCVCVCVCVCVSKCM